MAARVTKMSIEMIEQTVNANLSEQNATLRVQVRKDAAGYQVLRTTVEGMVIRTLQYGLTARQVYTYLDGMVQFAHSMKGEA